MGNLVAKNRAGIKARTRLKVSKLRDRGEVSSYSEFGVVFAMVRNSIK